MLREDLIAWLKYECPPGRCQPARQENGFSQRNCVDMNLISCMLALTIGATPSAQTWLKDAEICNGWYNSWDAASISRMENMPFVVAPHPITEATIGKVHKVGARVLLYVTFYQMPPDEYYQHAKVSEHPDWICIHSDGTEGVSTLHSDRVTLCPNSPGFRDYALKTTKLIMAKGADGLFIDNGDPDLNCEGPKFGRHKHIYPGKDNTYAYRKLLEEIRAEVKKHGEDKIVIVNPGAPFQAWVGACDGQMLESYICSWAWDNRWEERKILKMREIYGPLAEKGDAVVTLSTVGHTKNPVREDAYYCYAWSRLSGFIWADWFTGKDAAGELYRLRIGIPIGPMKTCDGYFMREFERGLVVVSSQEKGASFKISAKDHPQALDLFNAVRLKPGPSGDYEITLPPGAGRVYMMMTPGS